MSLPNWIHSRYLALADQYKEGSFGFEEAVQVLQKRFGDKEDQIKLVMSELRKAHFIEVERSEEDSRKKVYTLVSLSDQKEKGKLTRGDIDKVLKKAADLIRTRVDYSFILLLLFYKRFSDQWNVEYRKAYQEAIKDKFSDKEADTEARKSAYHKINIPEEYSWEAIRKDTLKISENFSQAIKSLADLNPPLRETFQQFDFSDFTRNPENNEILRQLVELFSSYSFENVSPDILGDAYEWILRYFAPQKAKEGEVYTPREVIQLMVELLDPQEGDSVYDPAAGSSGMLIAAYKHVEEKHSKAKADSLYLYGQEQNPKTLSLAKMNLLIHDIANGMMGQGDTLRFPKFKDGQSIKRFSHVLANPPWNQDGYDEEVLKTGDAWKERFPFGFPTTQSADWAWVQHMYASLKENGKLAVILDTGAALRGSGSKSDKEKGIRNKFIELDLVDTVILLPENLFYNTGSPGLILMMRNNKPKERQGKILLINASPEFEKKKPKNFLKEENIERIVKVYQNFEEQEDFSKIITNEQAKEADGNLSPSRYVANANRKKHRVVKDIMDGLDHINNELKKRDEQLEKILKSIKVIHGLGQEEKEVLEENLPKSWSMRPLMNLCEKDSDIVGGPFGSNLKVSDYISQGVPIIQLQNINRNKFIYKDIKHISENKAKELEYHSFRSGDIVLAKLGIPIGKTCIVPEDLKHGIVVADVVRIRVNKAVADRDYISYALNSNFVEEQLRKTTRGSTRPRVNLSDVRNIMIPLPNSIEEQKRIAEYLRTIDTKIDLEGQKINLFKELFESMLSQLTTGKLNIK